MRALRYASAVVPAAWCASPRTKSQSHSSAASDGRFFIQQNVVSQLQCGRVHQAYAALRQAPKPELRSVVQHVSHPSPDAVEQTTHARMVSLTTRQGYARFANTATSVLSHVPDALLQHAAREVASNDDLTTTDTPVLCTLLLLQRLEEYDAEYTVDSIQDAGVVQLLLCIIDEALKLQDPESASALMNVVTSMSLNPDLSNDRHMQRFYAIAGTQARVDAALASPPTNDQPSSSAPRSVHVTFDVGTRTVAMCSAVAGIVLAYLGK